VVSETLQLDAAGACLFSYLLKAEPDVYSAGLRRACAPYAPAYCTSLGTPLFGIITIAISIYRGGDGDDSFCGGNHVRQTWDGCHLNPPGGHLEWHSARLRSAKAKSCCASYASCAAAWCGCSALSSQALVMTYRIPRHTRVSLPIVGKGMSKSSVMPLSGAEGGEPIATLASRRGVFGLSSHLPNPKSLHAGYCAKSVRSAVRRSGHRMSLVGGP
jgi:hypothetical protein